MEDSEFKKSEEEKPWRSSSLAERSLYALNTGYRSDCTFLVGTGDIMQSFSCHVLPLSWASSKLAKMLKEDTTHDLPHVGPRYFRKLLEFVYSDTTELRDMETTLGVWSVAFDLEVPSLNQYCSTHARRYVVPKNVCKALEFAKRIEDQEFEQICIQFIRKNTGLVLHSDSWEQISKDTLVTILSQDELNITSELELFCACVKWAKIRSELEENMREVLGNALGLIRFRTFTTEQFASEVCTMNLLTPVEQSNIFCCLSMGTATKMPEEFSADNIARGQRIAPSKSLSSHPSSASSISAIEAASDEEPTYDFETQMATQQEAEDLINFGNPRSAQSISSFLKQQSSIEKTVVPSKPKPSSSGPIMGEKASISLRYAASNPNHIVLKVEEMRKIPLSFSVSMAAFLFGVELRSRQNIKVPAGASYMESVQVLLRDSFGSVLTTGMFHGEVKHQDLYKVLFDIPFCLDSLKIYSIYVHHLDNNIDHFAYEVSFGQKYKTSWGMQCSLMRILQIKYYTNIRSIIFGKKV